MTTDSLKERWFKRGAEALRHTAAEADGSMYGCPLCLRAARSPKTFTFEHVPLRAVGGRRLCLTCPDCNNVAGTRLDHHVKRGAVLRAFASGAETMPVSLALRESGHRISARLRRTKDGFELTGVPEKSDERAFKAFFDHLTDAAHTGSVDWSLQLHWEFRYNANAEQVSWLRTAFLVAFAVLGYRYAYLNALAGVRRQIMEPDKPILSRCVLRSDGAAAGDQAIAFLRSPEPLRGAIAVQCGPTVTILPGLTDDGREYATHLAALSAGAGIAGPVEGPAFEWPQEPQYLLDFHPKAVPDLRRQQGLR